MLACLLVGWLVGCFDRLLVCLFVCFVVGFVVCSHVCLFVCLFVCLLVCLPVYLFVCLSVCLFVVFVPEFLYFFVGSSSFESLLVGFFLCLRIKTRTKPATKAGKRIMFGKEMAVKAELLFYCSFFFWSLLRDHVLSFYFVVFMLL